MILVLEVQIQSFLLDKKVVRLLLPRNPSVAVVH
jgi:hypothetical protein